jgi:PAS domain S-box-containing protein
MADWPIAVRAATPHNRGDLETMLYTDPSLDSHPAKRASALLAPAEASLLIAFLDHAPLPLAVLDDERRIVEVNGHWIELLGYPADHAQEMRIDDLVAAESRAGLAMRWSDLVTTGVGTARVTVVRADGSRLEVRYAAVANVLPGRHLAAFLSYGPPLPRPTRGRRAGRLTLREQESLRLVAMGLTTSAAAERLGISPETVRTHVRNAMNKLGARTRAQAIAVAMRDGEIPS